MRLLDLHLLAYGPFTDRRLDLSGGNEGLHVIFGPNEAGKSSALRALRALLYGVPERTRDDFRHGKSDLRVGGVLRGADGIELRCYRLKRRRDTLVDVNGEAIREDRLARLLGGVAQPLFERLFGIDHEALVSGGQALLAQRGQEAEALFGTGLGSTAVHSLLGALEQEAKALFAPRASKPLINGGLNKLAEIERQQREASLSARSWDEARRAVEGATRRLFEIDVQLAEEEKRRSALERIRRALPGLAKRARIRERLADLGDVRVLEDDFGSRREESMSKRRIALETGSKAAARLEGLRRDAAALNVAEELVAEAETIDGLRERLGSHRKAAVDKPALVAGRATLIEQAQQRLAEIRPGLSLEDIEQLRPLLSRRRRCAELGGRREALESAVTNARESLGETMGKLALKREALGRLPAPVSDEALRQAVDDARRVGDVDSAIEEAREALARHEVICQRDLESLGSWMGSVSDLGKAPLPSRETLQRFMEGFQGMDEEQRVLENSIAEARTEQRQSQEALRALRLAGAVPSEVELREARVRRDHGWLLLRRRWLEDEDVSEESQSYGAGREVVDVFEEAISVADDIADRLHRESQRVYDQAAAQAKLEACQQLAMDAGAALRQLGGRRSHLEQAWRETWSASGIVPLPPREMALWMDKAARLCEKVARGDELREKVNVLERVRESRRRSLVSALAICGGSQPDTAGHIGLRPLLDHAEARLRSIEQVERRRAALGETIADLENSRRRAGHEVQKSERALGSWSSEWATLMAGIGREKEATPGEVSDYLETVSDTLQLIDEARRLKLRIDGIDRDAKRFEQDVAALATRLAPGLSGCPVSDVISRLVSTLEVQREAKSRLGELNKQAAQAEGEEREAGATIQAANEMLDELCRQAGCETADQLQAVEQRSLEHRRLVRELREIENALVEGGDGFGIEALEAEARAVERDSVLAELAAVNQRIDRELRPEREAQLERKLDAEREFQAMAGGDQASALAEQAQHILSELRGHAENYARLRFAARVLRDEIEGFRRKHRDPILTRASAYFKKLTCGSMCSIETDFDESDQSVLTGVRPTGERLRVEAMSTGTRDQLYLALRLATLDHYFESSEPLPLIVDDILIQFDDERARATLDALANFSAKTQVILFTHHQRVAEQANGLADGAGRVFVHELS